MNDSSVNKLARVLRVLVVAVFVCSLLALTAVPLLTLVSVRDAVEWGVEGLGYLFGYEPVPEGYLSFTLTYFAAWIGIWIEPVHGVMAIFLWICGICTAVILWQAKRVLDNIIGGALFSDGNALRLRRAAVCSFVISVCSLLWAVFRGVTGGIWELFSLSTLFVPVFFLAGLLFLVMSALFRSAAELKAESDLTI